jgi:sulfite reductase (NADPH) flavoprotein alpha-component
MNQPPYIPETAPFTAEQRAWLNGFLAGLFASQPAPTPPPSAAPGEPLTILYGSQTGSAEGLAKGMAKESAAHGFSARVFELNDFEKAGLTSGGRTIIISSTWGDGDPPDNAANFWNWLKSDSAPRLENLQFAVLGLGDRNYADFCGASKKFDERLAALGARRLVPRGECDIDYEAPARLWMTAVWEKLGGRAAINGSATVSAEASGEKTGHDKKNPFPARLLRNVPLNQPGSDKEVRHFEISLEGSGLNYEAGDALGVVPSNCPELVDALLSALHCQGADAVYVEGTAMPLRDALIFHYDITKPSSDLLAAVAAAAPHCELVPLLAPERAAELKKWLWGRDVLDVLGFLTKPLPADQLLPLLRKLAPRLYSISSSPKAHPGQVHLTVGIVRYPHEGRIRKGVASTCLADRVREQDRLKVFVQPSPGFKLPANPDTPMIMVGPGTGIAPFRAFLEEREAAAAPGKNWLFFGDRRRATDFLYEDQLTSWLKNSHLARLDLAFSQAAKSYVQHAMLENAGGLWAWLEAGAHFYVCGDASRMAGDVDSALHSVIQTAGGKSADEARAYVARMKSGKRYQRDVY